MSFVSLVLTFGYHCLLQPRKGNRQDSTVDTESQLPM